MDYIHELRTIDLTACSKYAKPPIPNRISFGADSSIKSEEILVFWKETTALDKAGGFILFYLYCPTDD